MKKLIFTILVMHIFCILFAQDIIYKHDGSEISSRVIKINTDFIKYKKFEQQSGPIRNIKISDVFMIIYEDGTQEVFKKDGTREVFKKSEPAKDENAEEDYQEQKIEVKPKDDKSIIDKKYKYFSIAMGYGNSYGSRGIRLQGRIGGAVGVGFHGGIGYFPSILGSRASILGSGGVKFFPTKCLYIDAQFGAFNVGKQYDYYYTQYYKRIIYGPSFLVGGDWFLDENFGFNGALGLSFNVGNSYFSTVFLGIDLGFFVKF